MSVCAVTLNGYQYYITVKFYLTSGIMNGMLLSF